MVMAAKQTKRRELETARERLSALLRSGDGLPADYRTWIKEALEAFSITIEELQATEEELRQQNEQIVEAREELTTEHRRYLDLFEFAPDGYLVTDPQGLIRAANRAAAALLGVRQEMLAGKPLSLYLDESGRLSFQNLLQRLGNEQRQAEARSAEWEVHVRPRNGPAFPAALTVAPTYGAKDEVAEVRWLLRDITASKRAEERERLMVQIEQDRQSIENLVQGLEREQDILQTIMENTHAQLAYLDPQFNFVRVNSAYAEGAGFGEEELIGRNHFDLFPDDENQVIFEHVRDTGQPVAFQARAFTYYNQPELGTTYWDWTLVPVKDSQGQVEGLVLSLLDVTERVRAEATLHRREQEFRALAEHAPDIIARFDRALHHTYVNPAVEPATGIPCEGFIGKTNRELGMPDELCSLWDENIGQVFETGQEAQIEYSFAAPGGQRHYESRLAPEFGPDGSVESVLSITHDITAHKETLAQLEAERARLNAIIENAPEAIVVADQDCHIVLANPAAERLYIQPTLSDQDLDSQTGLVLHGSEGAPYDVLDLLLTRSAREGAAFDSLETPIHRPDGEQRDLLVSIAPIRDSHGHVSGAVGVFQDITERTRVEKTLQKRNYELRQFNKLAAELGATLELSQVLERVGEAVREVTGAESSSIWLWDEVHPNWLMRRAVFPPERSPILSGMRLRSGEGIAGWVAQRGESAVVPDTRGDPRFSPRLGPLQLRSILAVPLHRRGAVVGVLEALNKAAGDFDTNDRLLLETLANPAATAIENARLYDEARQSAAEAERSRLARELHDAVSQTLFSASVIAESLPRLWKRNPEKVQRGLTQLHLLTRGALAEMRALLLELRPTALVDANLNDLLRQLTDAFASRSRTRVSLTVEGQRPLPPDVQIALYRITQEALNNVIKHARAKEVNVHLQNLPDRVELRIEDNGRGFDLTAIPPERLGLKIIRERAGAIGATLEIESEAGHGTQVVVVWQVTP
jgi:PAS domain S-box-containing protein